MGAGRLVLGLPKGAGKSAALQECAARGSVMPALNAHGYPAPHCGRFLQQCCARLVLHPYFATWLCNLALQTDTRLTAHTNVPTAAADER